MAGHCDQSSQLAVILYSSLRSSRQPSSCFDQKDHLGNTRPSTHKQFLRHVLTADFDFALVLAGRGQVVGKLHP